MKLFDHFFLAMFLKQTKNNVIGLFGWVIILFWMFEGCSIGAHRVYFSFVYFFIQNVFLSCSLSYIKNNEDKSL